MAPPLTLQEWMLWNKKRNLETWTNNSSALTSEAKQMLLDEAEDINNLGKPTLKHRFSYLCYLACATTTRIVGWIVFVCLLIAVICITCFVTMARMQWKQAIITHGAVIDWNQTTHKIIPVALRSKRSPRDLVRIVEEKWIEINATGIPQGVYLTPHPKPIIVKERILGLSQIVLINSESIASSMEIKQEHKSLLTKIINEEMKSLRDVMLDFELPLDDPKTQKEYIQQRCFQEFKDCYLVKYNTPNKPWPTDYVLQDMCPLPGGEYPPQNAWNYYLKIQNIRPKDWTSGKYYGSARMGGFWVPPKLKQQNFTHVLFCSNKLYGKWYNSTNTVELNENLLLKRLTNLFMNNESSSQLKNRAMPREWHSSGQNALFRNITRIDYCMLPEAVILLNTTKTDYSLWEGDCNIYTNNVTKHPACANFDYKDRPKLHPYTCRHWRLKEQEQTKCLGEQTNKCIYYPAYSSPEYLWDFGWLAYNGNFPSPVCEQQEKIREPKYELYSLYGECMRATEQLSLEQVLLGLHGFIRFQHDPITQMPKERAFIGLDSPKWPPIYPNVTGETRASCPSKRQRRDVDNNWNKLQKAGYAITNSVKQIAQISDLNDESIVSGLYLLRDHVVTLMEATLHDVSALEDSIAIQHFHTHLMQLKLLLMENRVDWSYIDTQWIKTQLQLNDEDMKVLRRTARALVYNIDHIEDTKTSTIWEIAMYYEIIVPSVIYSTNWNVQNVGHLIASAGSLTLVKVKHPYEIINQECGIIKYLHIENCQETDYVICDTIEEVQPCGNQTGSDCPVLAEPVPDGFHVIESLKNGSYIYMSHYQDCSLTPYIPQVVTVNATIKCLGRNLKPPLSQTEAETNLVLTPQVPRLKIQLPHLVGVITKLKGIQVKITSTWETIKDQIDRAQAELLRLDLHEGDSANWLKQLSKATEDIWPAAAATFGKVGDFLSGTFGGLFGTLGYIKPIIVGIVILLLIVIVCKILSWLPSKRKTQ
ncbi:env [Spider monkey simian foamy virus]|uniref:Envelope glycoprotein gp130 n=1 Tax=Spider monkey simian foamy virus TaxID=2170200 RepID=A8HC79_9RETR|nr:env [Spider monkey simian foamy virus]ABV59400.1 env [Spider monkey simian foamy virus]